MAGSSKAKGKALPADERCFINPWITAPVSKDLALPQLHTKLRELISTNLQHFKGRNSDNKNQSIYTGEAGIALLHVHVAYRLYHSNPVAYREHLQTALQLLRPCLYHLDTKRVTFLCGAAGPLAVAAYVYHLLGDPSKCRDCVSKLKGLSPGSDSELPYELLYGRAGYLYALLFVGALVPGALDEGLISNQVEVILAGGHRGGAAPLMYTWHSKHYLGAAHGLAGILTILLQVTVEPIRHRILSEVKNCVEYLLLQLFPSGNLPSSLESAKSDRLVQWCHGAPGLVHLLAQAYKVFKKKRYLDAALACGEVVWQRGLLLKGYSLCHGVSGNAYTFLQLYRLDTNPVHLYRAIKFAEWCMSKEERACSTPDHPDSLFEGLAGETYLYCDLLSPEKATFPSLELPTP